MVSPISATISVAAGGAASPTVNPQAAAAARSTVPDTNRLVQAVSEQAEKRKKKVEDSKDKRRGVEGEKKTEAAFTPHELKPRGRAAPGEEERDDKQDSGEGPPRVDRVDIIA